MEPAWDHPTLVKEAVVVVVLKVHQLAKEYGGQQVLEAVSFQLASGERVGLVGPNGCGKSTLLEILTGHVGPDGGQVRWIPAGISRGYMPQEPPWDPKVPLGEQLGPVPDDLLARWGLDRGLLHRPAGRLSGGQKTRAALVQALAGDPQVLLLDEPTNHLDVEGLEWLEETLQVYPGAVLVVSHDRLFLDRVVDRILALEDGRLRSYPGNYSAYAAQRQREQEQADAEYRHYLKEKRRLEEAIRREMEWARRAQDRKLPREYGLAKPALRAKAKVHVRKARAMEKRLHRMRKEPPKKEERINLAFGRAGGGSRTLIAAEEMGFHYPGGPWLFRGATFAIQRGERVLVVGPNGSGKTTLLRLLLGELEPSEGRLHRAPARAAFLAQELENLDHNRTVLAEASGGNEAADQAKVRTLLGCLLLGGDAVWKRVADLSGGERVRLAVAKLILAEPDLLVLDEPTNGLDLASRERVEEALEGFQGTLVVVSHDRYLLRRLGNAVLALKDGRILSYPGGYEAFQQHQAALRRRGEGPGDGAERRLLLETRLAQLAAQLADPPEGEAEALEEAYLAISRELSELRNRASPKA